MKPASLKQEPHLFDIFRQNQFDFSSRQQSEFIAEAYDRRTKSSFIIGVASIVLLKGKILLALAKRAYWLKNEKGLTAQVKLFGGKLEESETCIEALSRELREELVSRDLKFIDCEQSYYFNPVSHLREIEFLDRPRPLLVHEGIFEGQPGNPESPGYWHLMGFIYCSHLSDSLVAPASEVPGLLVLDIELFFQLSDTFKVSEALERGGSLIMQPDYHLGANDFIELGSTLRTLREWSPLKDFLNCKMSSVKRIVK